MRQVRPAEIGLPASVNRYLLPHERSCITVRMHPAVLGGHLILASGGLMAARKLTSRSGRPDMFGEPACFCCWTSSAGWQPGR